jgi:hypothetical protein
MRWIICRRILGRTSDGISVIVPQVIRGVPQPLQANTGTCMNLALLITSKPLELILTNHPAIGLYIILYININLQ